MGSLPFCLDKTLISGTERGYRGRQDDAVDPSRLHSWQTEGRNRGACKGRGRSSTLGGTQRHKECVRSRIEEDPGEKHFAGEIDDGHVAKRKPREECPQRLRFQRFTW